MSHSSAYSFASMIVVAEHFGWQCQGDGSSFKIDCTEHRDSTEHRDQKTQIVIAGLLGPNHFLGAEPTENDLKTCMILSIELMDQFSEETDFQRFIVSKMSTVSDILDREAFRVDELASRFIGQN